MKISVVGEKKGAHLVAISPADAQNWLEAKKIIVGQNTKAAINDVDIEKSFFFMC